MLRTGLGYWYGRTATSTVAQEMHAHIRKVITNQYGVEIAEKYRRYGGSCKPSNAQDWFAQSDVDGGLIMDS